MAYCLIATFLSLNAQTPIKKEVEVVKPYEPVVSDAEKINILPKINDSVSIKPNVQYNITPRSMDVEYQINPINAAKMLSMPVPKLYKTYLKLGIGNYGTPKAEVYINSLRSKTHTAGLFFKHQSSSGKIKLENDKKAFAGYSNTSGEFYGKKFLKSSYLYGNAGFNTSTVYHYGYNPKDAFGFNRDTTLEKGNIRQNYLLLNLRAGLQSATTDSSKLNYHTAVSYNFFQDRLKHYENNLNIAGQFFRQLDKGLFGLNTTLNVLGRNERLDSAQRSNTLFMLNPWMGLSSSDYKLHVGLNIAFAAENGSLKFRLYPKAEFQFVAVKDVIIPFLGITGQPIQHSYRDIATQNPFIRPDLLVKNSNLKLNFYGGLKGNLGARASYVAKFDYLSYNDLYFFVNDTSSVLQNQFTVAYSNTDNYVGSLELNYDYSDSWSFGAKTNIYGYNLTQELYPWHKQNFDLTLSAKYNLRNKILIDFDVVALGKRKAKVYSNPVTSRELPSVLDFNLGLEYRYTKILSFWLRFNNFTASKYEMWNQYPAQRFNMMAGFTYSL